MDGCNEVLGGLLGWEGFDGGRLEAGRTGVEVERVNRVW